MPSAESQGFKQIPVHRERFAVQPWPDQEGAAGEQGLGADGAI